MDRLRKILEKLIEIIRKSSLNIKIGIAVGFAILLIAAILTFNVSTSKPESMLFERPLTIEEFGAITSEIQNMGIDFSTKGEKYIIVADKEVGRNIRMKLAQSGKMPSSIKGWEIFDMQSWTTTEFDRNINLRRAIKGEMQKHLESLSWIENADVTLSMPKRSLYSEKDREVEASVTITPAPGYTDYLRDKKIIRGIEAIVAKGIDGLKRDNIVISDYKGVQINDFSVDDVQSVILQAKEENKIKRKYAQEIETKVRKALKVVLTEDRYTVSVEIEMSFDKEKLNKHELKPVIIKPRTSGLSYDDSIIKDKLELSVQTEDEEYKGQGFIPEGPPGVEPNIPPGYKESLEEKGLYTRNKKTVNYEIGKENVEIVKDASEILKKSVSVLVDGTWEKELDAEGNYIFEGQSYIRKYFPVSKEDIKSIEEAVKGAIAFSSTRGDTVVVKNIAFDRKERFLIEDQKYIKQKEREKALTYSVLAVLFICLGFIAYKLISHEMLKRKLRKEKELERELELQREQAINRLEEENNKEYNDLEVDLSKQNLQKNIERIAEDKPEEVAKLLRNWLSEEG